jgi:hypothetical protein
VGRPDAIKVVYDCAQAYGTQPKPYLEHVAAVMNKGQVCSTMGEGVPDDGILAVDSFSSPHSSPDEDPRVSDTPPDTPLKRKIVPSRLFPSQ